jgi:hypothetical protein
MQPIYALRARAAAAIRLTEEEFAVLDRVGRSVKS